MNRGIPEDAIRTGIGARVDVASGLSIPVQRLDSVRHTISERLGSIAARAAIAGRCRTCDANLQREPKQGSRALEERRVSAQPAASGGLWDPDSAA